MLSRYLVATFALVLFNTACDRQSHYKAQPHAAQSTEASKPVVTVEKTEVVAAAEPAPRKAAGKAFAVYAKDGEDTCSKGMMATYEWHKNTDPHLRSPIDPAIVKLKAAKASGSGVEEAGKNVRLVFDSNMATIDSFRNNYGPSPCTVQNSDGKIIGSEQLMANDQEIKDFVANDPSVPARPQTKKD